MVIVKSLWWGLQEHMVVPEVMADRLLRRTVEHLQECMTYREAQLEARAEDMRDSVTKRVEMGLMGHSPQSTLMDVRPQSDWRLRPPKDAGDEAGQAVDEQKERSMACRRKRVRQV